MNIKKSKIKRVEQVGNFDDEYVYDIGIKSDKGHNWFFGNNILAHNSIYFTIGPIKERLEKELGRPFEKEDLIALADRMARLADDSFSDFLMNTYNVPKKNAEIIKCDREICASMALFIKKKRYAFMVFDKEGIRQDKNGKPGKLKITGIDINRSDCPKWVQDKLSETLQRVLSGYSENDVLEFIRDWRSEFQALKPWEMGRPIRANNLTHYGQIYKNGTPGVTVPGHVRASIHWNDLLEYYDDKNSAKILDGGKIIVCALKPNKHRIRSIAYPIDQSYLPEWFKNLDFDTETMLEKTIDMRLRNILGVLKWDLDRAKESDLFRELYG